MQLEAKQSPSTKRQALSWVPSLYFAEGIPYVIVMTVSVVMYKRLGICNTEIGLYTSLLYLPWVIKPLWSPLVDVTRTKRWWIIAMQLLIGAGLAGVALSLPTANFFRYTLAFFWLLALSSATHDIAADGFYMLGLTSHDQAWFVGIRSTFYRLAMIAGQGLLVMLAGFLESASGLPDTLVTVEATTATSPIREFKPAKFADATSDRSQRILTAADSLSIPLGEQSSDKVAAAIKAVNNWNTEHGFYEAEIAATKKMTSKPDWLLALESWIKTNFGSKVSETSSQESTGGIAIVQMRVGQAPENNNEITVQFERESGSEDYKVVEGTRFTVASDNWQQPFASVIQLDKRARKPESAVFRTRSGNFKLAWTSTFYLVAGLFVGLCTYHWIVLPSPASDRPFGGKSVVGIAGGFRDSFSTFFLKPDIGRVLAFLLFYRFSEAQLVKLAAPFLLDSRQAGGLSLSTGQVGFVYGTIGVAMLTVGGIVGGLLAARHGLRHWLWWMALAINAPNAVYLILSLVQPEELWPVLLAVGVEQLGYGFGFTAYMVYMLYVSQGAHETAHYALCTGFMALGMMLPGMISGWIQDLIGYEHFFHWVLISTLPGLIATYFIYVPLSSDFGKKVEEETGAAT